MSALAEDRANIDRILVTKELNHAGVYQVRLCRSGVWHCVVIDDVLPINGLSCLAYLKAARRSLWPCLIEKAAAKLEVIASDGLYLRGSRPNRPGAGLI